MTRNLRALGLALVAVFALSALAASAAQAAEEFHAHKGNGLNGTDLTGEQVAGAAGTQIFTVTEGGLELKCKKAVFKGTVPGTPNGTTLTAPSATVHPEYSECEGGGLEAIVTTGTCHYNLTAATNVNGDAAVHIEGPDPCITIHIPAIECTVHINPQTVTGVHYTNQETETNKKDITVKATVTGIHSYSTGELCFLGGIPATSNTGSYTGEVTVKGFEDLEPSNTEAGVYHHGAQVGIWKE